MNSTIHDLIKCVVVRYNTDPGSNTYHDCESDDRYWIATQDIEKCITALIAKSKADKKTIVLVKIFSLSTPLKYGGNTLKGFDYGQYWSGDPDGYVYMSSTIYDSMGQELHDDNESCAFGANGGDYDKREFISHKEEFIAEEYKHLFY